MKPYLVTPTTTLYQGDALEVLKQLPANSVQMCVTSPPYWGLRDYGVSGQLGMEETPDEFVANLVVVFREVRRVLRNEGTLWLNLANSSSGSGKGQLADGSHATNPAHKQATNKGAITGGLPTKKAPGLKPKDIVGIPWMTAFALQKDGWYLRSDIIWSKPNPMPESVSDRPTRAHEYLFLFSKQQRYFYDAEAIKEPSVETNCEARVDRAQFDHKSMPDAVPNGIRPHKAGPNSHANVDRVPREGITKQDRVGSRTYLGFNERYDFENPPSKRNKRDVWEIATAQSHEEHFATYPAALVEPCILAGTSEAGCCSVCGTPWERVTNVEREPSMGRGGQSWTAETGQRDSNGGLPKAFVETVGWQAACEHKDARTEPCDVLDPFTGSGTTNEVAARLGRRSIGIDLNPKYLAMAAKRISKVPLPMNLSVEARP